MKTQEKQKTKSSAVRTPIARRARVRTPERGSHQYVRDDAGPGSPAPTLQGEKQSILECAGRGEEAHWDMGIHVNVIVDNQLAQTGGYSDSRKFFMQEIGDVPLSTLTRNGAVARAFTRDVSRFYGMNMLYRLLTYQRLEGKPKLPTGDPGTYVITVPAKDGSTKNTPFSGCSLSDLNAAIRAGSGKVGPSLNPEVAGLLQTLQDSVSEVGTKVVITAQKKSGGTVVHLQVPSAFLQGALQAMLLALNQAAVSSK